MKLCVSSNDSVNERSRAGNAGMVGPHKPKSWQVRSASASPCLPHAYRPCLPRATYFRRHLFFTSCVIDTRDRPLTAHECPKRICFIPVMLASSCTRAWNRITVGDRVAAWRTCKKSSSDRDVRTITLLKSAWPLRAGSRFCRGHGSELAAKACVADFSRALESPRTAPGRRPNMITRHHASGNHAHIQTKPVLWYSLCEEYL